jgi:hypothetical protein
MIDCLIFLVSLVGFVVLCAYISCASKNTERLNRFREETEDECMILRMEDYAVRKSTGSKRHAMAKAA